MQSASQSFRAGLLLLAALLVTSARPCAQSSEGTPACGVVLDLGLGTPGWFGQTPLLSGAGTLCAGDPVTLTFSLALPSSSAHLVIGFDRINAPFKGGTLVPSPDLVIFGIDTRKGLVFLPGSWPPGVTVPLYFQVWILDSAGPAGFSASNGLAAVPGS